jgi:coenzyme PQQ precursor peptide PqqA
MNPPPASLDGRRPGRYHSVSIVKHVGVSRMAWKTPKIVEIALGAEINSYASAGLK